jgi:hypothetical protein
MWKGKPRNVNKICGMRKINYIASGYVEFSITNEDTYVVCVQYGFSENPTENIRTHKRKPVMENQNQ